MKTNKSLNYISFSIIGSSYNQEDFIQEAIESVISQSYPYWELIIVDDASTDKTVEKIKPFLKDHRIKLIIHETNKGAGAAIRNAVKHTTNEILAELDLDDKLHEKALETMANAYMKNPDYGFIYSTHWICNSKLQKKRISTLSGPVDPRKTNLIERKASHFKTFKKEVYKKTQGYNPIYKMCTDGDISFKLEEVTKLKFINVPLYYYRKHKDGASIKHLRQVEIENYIAKLHAYHRRLNTNITNLNIEDLYIEYYNLMFFKIITFFIFIKEYFRITHFVYNLFTKFSFLPLKVKKELKKLKVKYFYWF